jgi:hypothetical protein
MPWHNSKANSPPSPLCVWPLIVYLPFKEIKELRSGSKPFLFVQKLEQKKRRNRKRKEK